MEVDYTRARALGQRVTDGRHEAVRQVAGGWVNTLTAAGGHSAAVHDLADTRLAPYLVLRVNGVRIAARGGSWGTDDMMKRIGRARLEPFFRLHRDAGVNIIRNWVGQNTEPVFYDLADEYGLLVANDFWASTQNFQMEPADVPLFLANAADTIARYRNHPSIALWFGRNEGMPQPILNEGLQDLVYTLDGTRWYNGSSNQVGLWTSGPYNYREPDTYFTEHAKGFAVEVGSPSFPTLEAFEAAVPPSERWPISDSWAYHDWHQDGNGSVATFMAAMAEKLGAATDLADFERKAQLLNYETYRAIMEGMNAQLWTVTSGRMLWMTQPAWLSTMWQIMSHDGDTHAAYYGFKTAAEPVHVQMTPPDHRLQLVNNTRVALHGLEVSYELVGLDGARLGGGQTDDLLFGILVQLVIMIGAARVANTLFRAWGQPGVVGEIVAGLLLGPSLFGHLFPGASLAVFGAKASAPISVISQIGLVLLMFQIGTDFEFGHLSLPRNRGRVLVIAAASVAVPFALGVLIGVLSQPALAPHADRTIYSLFMGVGLAITAVPILGRILRQFDLHRTEVGVVAISAAALNDVAGWVLLASISALATARFSPAGLVRQLAEVAGFAALLWVAGRPLATCLVGRPAPDRAHLPPNLVASVLCLLFLCGMATKLIGIFTIFGGFAAGLLFHGHRASVSAWARQVGGFVIVFFLPVFFTSTGLRTNVLGLTTGTDWAWLGAILAASVAGKMLPVYGAARLSGFSHGHASILGTLMNTRALMELIVLNIGFDLGFIPQRVFTMLVVMAVATTVMTGPLLTVLLPRVGHRVPAGVEA